MGCIEAAASEDNTRDRGQKCEAHYYIGQYYLIAGQRDKAKACFEAAVETGVRHFTEYQDAQAELRAMAK